MAASSVEKKATSLESVLRKAVVVVVEEVVSYAHFSSLVYGDNSVLKITPILFCSQGGRGCFKCGEEGHMSRECPNAESGGGRSGEFIFQL